jgi:transposase InsO family protein
VSAICRTLDIGRATAYRPSLGRPRHYACAADALVTAQVQQLVRERPSYGYRRLTVMINRAFGTRYNRKRIQRVMQRAGLTVPCRRRRTSGRAHTGRIVRPGSNERWCSDSLTVRCWSGELVELGFVLDCCDRECLATVAVIGALAGADIRRLLRAACAQRFGQARPTAPLELLSDNESMYTALETVITAERLGLTPITTPAYSPQSNGVSEAFVQTLRRDYLDGADLATAGRLLAQWPGWIADYNTLAPHSALGYRAPVEYRRMRETV